MSLTLNDIKVGRTDKYDRIVIDTFLRKSQLLAAMTFADCVSPSGGSTMTYGYVRLSSAPAAEGRSINSEYTHAEAKKTPVTTNLQIMGGSYKIDRVLAKAGPDEIAFQAEEKIAATVNRFHYLFINGNADNTNEFDGIAEAVNGSVTDFDCSAIDCSTMSEANAIKITEALDTAIAAMKATPTYILANSKSIVKIQSAAKMLGYRTQAEDSFGKPVAAYNGIPMLDLGRYYNDDLGSDVDIIPLDGASGKTSIYLVALGMSDVHGVSLSGDKTLTSTLPDLSTAGAVKEGDVEFVASVAVKNTRSVARLHNIQVQATLSAVGSLTVAATLNKATVTPSLPAIDRKYVYAKSNASIAAPTANTAVNMSVYANLPTNGVIALSANDFVRVIEVDKASLLPIATGQSQYTV